MHARIPYLCGYNPLFRMKRLVWAALVLLLSFPTVAQDKPAGRKDRLEVVAGYSLPLGPYASDDRASKRSGYAGGGWIVQATYHWMGRKATGIALQYSYQRNPMKNAVNEVWPNGIPDSAGAMSWSNHYLTAGPVYSKTLGKFQVDGKLLGGVVVSTGNSFDTPDPAGKATGKAHRNLGIGFAVHLSGGVDYAITRGLFLRAGVGLTAGWPGKEKEYGSQIIGYEETIDPVTGLPHWEPIYSAPVTYEIRKTILALHPVLGLVFTF